MALFVLASKDGWVSIMHTGLDAVGVDQQVRPKGSNTVTSWKSCIIASLDNCRGYMFLSTFSCCRDFLCAHYSQKF